MKIAQYFYTCLTLLCFAKISTALSFDLENTAQSPNKSLKISLISTSGRNYFTVDGIKSGYWKVDSKTELGITQGFTGVVPDPSKREFGIRNI